MQLTVEQHLQALEVLKNKIQTVPLSGFDSEVTGDKDTQCTWGLCCREEDRWPKDTRVWPDRPLIDGMVYGIKEHLGCPMDKREVKSVYGCFYHCRFFQGPKPTREQALELVQLEIKKHAPL